MSPDQRLSLANFGAATALDSAIRLCNKMIVKHKENDEHARALALMDLKDGLLLLYPPTNPPGAWVRDLPCGDGERGA